MTNATTAAAWTWGQTVATTGTGPTAAVEIDVRVPGHGEPEPVVVPLADARVLHAMLGDAIREVGEGGEAAVTEAAPVDRAAVLRELAGRANPQRPEVSWFGDDGPQVAAWISKQADYEERRMAERAQQPTPRQWCKCPSCWGWFVEDHPGEDLNDLGKDLGWWSGLPEHRDAPADEAPRPETHAAPGQPCTCADAGDCFAPVGHYADCPQARGEAL